MVFSATSHLVTEGYFLEPSVLRGNQLAIASEYRVLFVPVPPVPPRGPRVLDARSPAVISRGERDLSQR